MKWVCTDMTANQTSTKYTERQLRVIAEIQRVAAKLGVDRLSQRDFDLHHELAGCSTAGYQFGSWNRAVRAAGLQPYKIGNNIEGPKLADDELLKEIIRLHELLGKPPSEREMARFGNYSPRPYKARWQSWITAREAAYTRFGKPSAD